MSMTDKTMAEAALRERLKELSCLYEVVRLAAEQQDGSLEDILQGIADLLPSAWQHTDIAEARVTLDGRDFPTRGFVESDWKQASEIIVDGKIRGRVEVVYLKSRHVAFEGPFLREERNLIDALAAEVSGIVERYHARSERARLEEQILHADRLATIGQLAAGVAHELNEPLSNILGFAQLAAKTPELPDEARSDLEKIVSASMHAREIVRKLRLFARQTPARREEVNLNDTVSEGLYFIESRCAKQGIRIERRIAPDLPPMEADPSQLHQVLTNLTVNAIQAMPDGGSLVIETGLDGDQAVLIVEDTGEGMSEEVKRQIFLPFYTTKDVDQGTGLGLSVVDGIVQTHGGSIKVATSPGKGTRFEIRIPLSGLPSGSEVQI